MARTKAERLWIAGGALGALIVAAVAYGFAISPKLSQADSLRSQTSDTQMQNMTLEGNVGRLRSDYAKIDQLRKLRDEARMALPTDNHLAALTAQLNAQAHAAHVSVSLLTTGDPAPVSSAAPTTSAAASSSSSSSSSTSAAPTPTSTAATGGLYTIPIEVTVTGTDANDLRFLNAVQHGAVRAALVGSVQLTDTNASPTGGQAGGTTMMITMQVFVEAEPSAATPAPTPTPTSTAIAAGN